jgi:hypothetical protein
MRNPHRSATKLPIIIYAFASAASLYAGPIYVGNCGRPSQPTIQAAVNASQPGGMVFICPGTYSEQVTITKNLNVSGVAAGNANQVVIAIPTGGISQNATDPATNFAVAAQVLVESNANVRLSNVTVDGANNNIMTCGLDLRGVYYLNASGEIENVATRNQILPPGFTGCQSGQGIFVQAGYGVSLNQRVNIHNNSVHSFEKNGITADGNTLQVQIQNNYIVGQGPTTGAAENGIQISDGAQGHILQNVISDEIWAPDMSSDRGDAARGILIVGSENVEVAYNIISSTQFAIAAETDSGFGTPGNPNGLADKSNIHNNQIMGTQIFDAIDACSNNNQIQGNKIYFATEAGVYLDPSCGTASSSTGMRNQVGGNNINEACTAVLEGATPNFIDIGNNVYNVPSEILVGNACTAGASAAPSIAGASAEIGTSAAKFVHPRFSPAR